MNMKHYLAFMLLSMSMFAFADTTDSPKNVIIIIGDGAGYGSWEAIRAQQNGDSAGLLDSEWYALSMSTFPLVFSDIANLADQDSELIYDSDKAWNTERDSKSGEFAGYKWRKKRYTDSAAAGTAMSTGRKTYNSAINLDNQLSPLTTMAEVAKATGRSVGIVTTVQISHATPATFAGAKVPSRNQYGQIARQIFRANVVDVWMGAGHPAFDDNGDPTPQRDYTYVSDQRFVNEMLTPQGPWTLVEKRADFQKMAKGETPQRVLGLAPVKSTLRCRRTKPIPNPNVPTLPEMTFAAINVLDANARGFFMMIEAGAVDWANHDNKQDRLLEEMDELSQTVKAVSDAISNGEYGMTWENTTLIVTADHETGLVLGQNSDVVPFDTVKKNTNGKLHVRYHTKSHSNSLVPFYVRGFAIDAFKKLEKKEDSHYGLYIDNTQIAPTVFKLLRL